MDHDPTDPLGSDLMGGSRAGRLTPPGPRAEPFYGGGSSQDPYSYSQEFNQQTGSFDGTSGRSLKAVGVVGGPGGQVHFDQHGRLVGMRPGSGTPNEAQPRQVASYTGFGLGEQVRRCYHSAICSFFPSAVSS